MFLALVPALVNTIVGLLDNSSHESAKGVSVSLTGAPKIDFLNDKTPEGIDGAPKVVAVPLGVLEVVLDILSGDVSEASQDVVRVLNLAIKPKEPEENNDA